MVEKIWLAVEYSKINVKPDIVGTIRNVKEKYAIFIVASHGECLPVDALYNLAYDKAGPNNIVEIIVYWVDEEHYRIDYRCKFLETNSMTDVE